MRFCRFRHRSRLYFEARGRLNFDRIGLGARLIGAGTRRRALRGRLDGRFRDLARGGGGWRVGILLGLLRFRRGLGDDKSLFRQFLFPALSFFSSSQPSPKLKMCTASGSRTDNVLIASRSRADTSGSSAGGRRAGRTLPSSPTVSVNFGIPKLSSTASFGSWRRFCH